MPEPEETPRPLRRLRELVRDLEDGIAREDLHLVVQASSLLEAVVADCHRLCETCPTTAGEAAAIALETRALLDRCERHLLQAMARCAEEIRRLKQGKQVCARARTATERQPERIDTRQ
ncbi:MAG: hypothetical protein RMJ43_04170 [Chloroherpetonaceae bacterium]|nr:hypothetical protein [Chthonomonadaceae bacterium]MDW8207008.1 hypothetical protein [Chloroherpetonaceae bacterium]